ncbi:hypothetical protein BDB01DRAFT_779625 [Pilobolus umbonatus]|nr:hypothetical protein BDB01DRAFT_779625 [Pilobolus umbonatus]
MDFAPYSPSPDDDRSRKVKGKSAQSSFFQSYQAGNASSYAEQGLLNNQSSSSNINNIQNHAQSVRVNKYETTLPIRVDIEASLAYILGPVSGLIFLILERQNDYVRFHAWQSCLAFSSLMVLQFILMFISTFLSWVLFFFSIGLLIGLTYKAYLDGASLERYELPYIGPMAAEWVDTE